MAVTAGPEGRSVVINIRSSAWTRDLIDHAAELQGKTRTEFMLETARRAAMDTVLNQSRFLLDDEAYGRFVEALDAPVKPNAALRALLQRKAPWER